MNEDLRLYDGNQDAVGLKPLESFLAYRNAPWQITPITYRIQ